MNKILICLLLLVNIFGINTLADAPFELRISGTLIVNPDGTNGISYDSTNNTLKIEGGTYANFSLTASQDLIIEINGNVTLNNSVTGVINAGSNKIYLKLNDSSSLTLTWPNGLSPYTGSYPIYKYLAKTEYGKDVPYDNGFEYKASVEKPGYYDESTLQTSLVFNLHDVNFNNVAEISGTLKSVNYLNGIEAEGDTFESVSGFVLVSEATKSISYADNVYTLELTDYTSATNTLYIELLFKESEIGNTLTRQFVTSDLSSVVEAPTSTYDIENVNSVIGSMYKDALDNHYYSYYITMQLKDGVTRFENFSMKLSGLNDTYKYINVKFKSSNVNNDPEEIEQIQDNNDDDNDDNTYIYVAPNTSVR